MKLSDYQAACSYAAVDRDAAGVLTIRIHSDGDSLVWGLGPHQELTELFEAVAADRDNTVVVITGTGECFNRLPEPATGRLAGGIDAQGWDVMVDEATRLVKSLLAIQAPIIAAVNGPITLHSEIAVLSDIVLCTPHTYFQDAGHYAGNIVPGDSMHLIWPLLLGPNHGRYFLLTGEKLQAAVAHQRGVVAEILEPEDLMARAQELAAMLGQRHPVVNRNTRNAILRPLKRLINEDLEPGLMLEALAALAVREEIA
jgi:enoyl-CoA hydratase/carnithine racemase